MSTDFKYVGKQFLILILILVLALLIFALGLMIGYALIGNGSHPTSILSFDKWSEIGKKFTGQ